MIVARLEQIAQQAAIPPRLRKGLEFLQQLTWLAQET